MCTGKSERPTGYCLNIKPENPDVDSGDSLTPGSSRGVQAVCLIAVTFVSLGSSGYKYYFPQQSVVHCPEMNDFRNQVMPVYKILPGSEVLGKAGHGGTCL